MNEKGEKKLSDIPSDEESYRRDVLYALFIWSLTITLAMGIVYLIAFWYWLVLPNVILGTAFSLFPLIAWWCLRLLRQGQIQQAMRIFMAIATVLAALFVLFMPDNLVLIGMMGIFLLVRIGTFLDNSKAILLLGGLWALLYLVALILRPIAGLPQVSMGSLIDFFWYIVPVAILLVFVALDRTVTQYLREALSSSEAARHELVRSYADLERQKDVLEMSEANLSTLTIKLEHSNYELWTANEELNSFAYAVAHDIRAPLRAIRNYADFLYEDLAETLNGEQRKYINNLVRAVHEGEGLVEDLLMLSSINHQGGLVKTINLGEFLSELVASLELSPDVEVEWAESWPTLKTVPSLLQQIFQNLILNAIKFNHTYPKHIELGWRPIGEENYEFFVRDNGIGIAPRYHEQIFGVFQRLHGRDEYEGTGIGLAIVKKAVDKLHGSIRLESTPDQGSTFYVSLPNFQRAWLQVLPVVPARE